MKYFKYLASLPILISLIAGAYGSLNYINKLTAQIDASTDTINILKVEVENLINKIESNQEIEDNQIKPIVNNIKMKKDKGTYTEQFGMRAFRYVVDSQITSTVSEEFRNEVASSLLAKYE